MHITYLAPAFEHSIRSIMEFQQEGEAAYWSDSIFYFYPQIDQQQLSAMTLAEKQQYLTDTLRPVFDGLQPEWARKVEAYNRHWQAHRAQVEAAFTDAFGVDVRLLFNDLTGCITLNPVSPRYLTEHTFDVFHLNSEYGAVGLTLHEMIHFLWFHLWNRHFHDSYDEYERPSLKWILSEMVVEPIMRDERLSSINPYFPREKGGCVYGYFQDMVIDGQPILDTLDDLYHTRSSIQGFMEEGLRYCQQHEDAIRAHIAAAEEAF